MGVYPLGKRLISVTFQTRLNERLKFSIWLKLCNKIRIFGNDLKLRIIVSVSNQPTQALSQESWFPGREHR